jgi:hypothetical protein
VDASVPERGPTRVVIRASVDRRSAEIVALALRRRLAELGLGDARITVGSAPSPPAPPPPPHD